MNSISRRRVMGQYDPYRIPKNPTADSYIQDGLVFQLDGIENGGIDGQWIDRVGGLIFEGDARHSDNCFLFNGSNSNVMRSRSTLPEISDVSADICYQNTGRQTKIFINANSVNSLRLSTDGNFKRNLPAFVPYTFASHIIHMQLNRGVDNGILMGTRSPLEGYQALRATVGGRQWGAWNDHIVYNPFTGSIYAIRVYSRQLTDEEIIYNQKIDNIRFELGLNIPDTVQPAS